MYTIGIALLFLIASIVFAADNNNTTMERSAVVRKHQPCAGYADDTVLSYHLVFFSTSLFFVTWFFLPFLPPLYPLLSSFSSLPPSFLSCILPFVTTSFLFYLVSFSTSLFPFAPTPFLPYADFFSHHLLFLPSPYPAPPFLLYLLISFPASYLSFSAVSFPFPISSSRRLASWQRPRLPWTSCCS